MKENLTPINIEGTEYHIPAVRLLFLCLHCGGIIPTSGKCHPQCEENGAHPNAREEVVQIHYHFHAAHLIKRVCPKRKKEQETEEEIGLSLYDPEKEEDLYLS